MIIISEEEVLYCTVRDYDRAAQPFDMCRSLELSIVLFFSRS
eukprot:SAG31_NODE_36143_length_316_cov_0.709677_1_plen_41_part_01